MWRGVRLAALEEAPYAYGSTFAQWRDASEERWRARMRDVPFNALAEVDDVPAGIACGLREDDGSALLISMWVAPFARGRGVGDALVRSVIEWARDAGVTAVKLDVVTTNSPAIELYRRNGFVENGASHRGEIDETPQIEMLLGFSS
ncbi:MAG TPA: GNAT family N-acetyltransferase [Candidatus Tumulicola sp.]